MTLDQDQIGFTTTGLEQRPLVWAADKGDGLPTIESPDRHGWRGHVPTQNAVIIGNRAGWFEHPLPFLIERVGSSNFRNTAHRDLGRQSKRRPGMGRAQAVQIKLPKGLGCLGRLADHGTRRIRRLERLMQGTRLRRREQQFDFGGQFHRTIIAQGFVVGKPWSAFMRPAFAWKRPGVVFLPPLKRVGLLRQFL